MAIVTILATLLYLALMYLAENLVGAQYWLIIILTAPFGLYWAYHLFAAVREGSSPSAFNLAFFRSEQPLRFWFSAIWFGSVIALLFGFCLYAVGKLIWQG